MVTKRIYQFYLIFSDIKDIGNVIMLENKNGWNMVYLGYPGNH